MRKCIIVGGAEIHNYEKLREYILPDSFFIFCDCGLKHADGLGVTPDLIVGDFDSYKNPCNNSIETIILPQEKDDTDSAYGVKEGLKRGYNEFLLLGMLGQRFDHTMVNLSLLLKLKHLGKKAIIADDYSEMEIIENESINIKSGYSFFSLISLSSELQGVTISNAKYQISDATIKSDFQYASSNETLPEKDALITVKKGIALVIRVF